MEFSENYNALGRIITKKLRDENYEYFLEQKEYGKSMTLTEYSNIPKNPNLDKEYQTLNDERFEFINGLNEKQLKVLERMVLNIIDTTAFNFLREVEENLQKNKSVGLTINGEKVESITKEFLSGTCFGEYFLWVEKNSKYGEFQQ